MELAEVIASIKSAGNEVYHISAAFQLIFKLTPTPIVIKRIEGTFGLRSLELL